MTARDSAIETIRTEHRSMRAVMKALQTMLAAIAAGQTAADHGLLSAAVYYLDEFPEKTHHPKEDRMLFPVIRAHGLHGALLDELQREHGRGEALILEMHRSLVHYLAGARHGLADLISAVDAYAAHHASHSRREEQLLAEAGEVLSGPEWRTVAEAYAASEDPVFGPKCRAEFRRLHDCVLALMPRRLWAAGPRPTVDGV